MKPSFRRAPAARGTGIIVDDGHKPVVLVVDDDARSRNLLEIVLTIEGYGVVSADGGAQALALIEQQSPDAVLLDFLMPGMDGPELCARIRGLSLRRRLPLVVLSGMDDPQARKAALEAGADDFVVKPFDRADLRDRLAALLGS
jgi:DNA-binding response OmpR family regulator